MSYKNIPGMQLNSYIDYVDDNRIIMFKNGEIYLKDCITLVLWSLMIDKHFHK